MEQWLQKMEWLATDSAARQAMAARGLQTIRERFSAEVVFRQLQDAFTQLAGATTTVAAPIAAAR